MRLHLLRNCLRPVFQRRRLIPICQHGDKRIWTDGARSRINCGRARGRYSARCLEEGSSPPNVVKQARG
eukprot:6037770-Lingulodinium_polyedra.AAC.1